MPVAAPGDIETPEEIEASEAESPEITAEPDPPEPVEPPEPEAEAPIAPETATQSETEAPGGIQWASEPSPEAGTPEPPPALEPPEIPESQIPDPPAVAEATEAVPAPRPPASFAVSPPPDPPVPPVVPAGIAAISTPLEPATPAAPPPSAIQLQAETRAATLVGGIDLGGTKIAAAIISPNHEILAYRRRPTPATGGPSDVIRAMAVTLQEAAQDAGVEAHLLRAVGVGSPGSVDTATGSVSGAGNLPGWSGSFPMASALREAIGTKVVVGNDVQVGTNAEYLLGAGAGYRSILGVFWGTGVGGGIVLNGKPWRGRGRAGEIGHTLVRRGGAPNSNGLNGTVEAYAGRKAMQAKAEREMKKGRESDLFKIMERHSKPNLTSAIWSHARDHGDELAVELLDRAVKSLSAGIASAVNLLDVEAVVIGGGMGVRFADSLVPEIIDGMPEYLLNKDNPPAVKVAGLGDEGGVIGASLLVS
ncbi:MAG: ROK family protein [Thermoleophilia bacterium]|nr:ROK family protein [Thermoleophilia bacterium]